MLFHIQNTVFQALDLLSSSSLPSCPPSSPKITECSRLKPPAERKCDCPSVTCASRAWQETHIEPIGPITPKLCSCSLQSSDCHCHCLSEGHCHSVLVIISSSPIGCHCLNISDIVWLSMSLFFLFTMSAYMWDSLYERRSVYNFNDFVNTHFFNSFQWNFHGNNFP